MSKLPFAFKHFFKNPVNNRFLREMRTAFINDMRDSFSYLTYAQMRQNHTPESLRKIMEVYYLDDDLNTAGEDNGIPLPPPDLRMDYMDDDNAHYIESGKAVRVSINNLMDHHNLKFEKNINILDWGCASGRVLRHFSDLTETSECWGVDQDERHIRWAKRHLDNFNFMTCTFQPHLPFEDNTFDFIYGISVFTHIEYNTDTWLMELKRILKPGGFAIFTVHGHATIEHFKKTGFPHWYPESLDPEEVMKHDISVYSDFSWYKHVFYDFKWLEKELSRYYEVLGIHPMCMDNWHSAAVLRKPATKN